MKTSAPTSRVTGSLFVCMFVLAVATANLHAQSTAVRIETFSLKPGGQVVVENSRGATRVESWEHQMVRVVAEKKAAPGNSIESGELVLMGAQNSILVQCKPGVGRVDLTLYLPASAQLQINGGAWPVEVSGTLASATVDTTSGSIGYRLPANDDARVAMRSTTGIVRSSLPLMATERIGTRSLRGQLGGGAAQIVLNSQNGNVTLTPGPNLTAIAQISNKGTGNAGAQASQSDGSARLPDSHQGSGDSGRESVEQADSGARSTRPSQSGGSVDLGGTDRSDDSSITAKSGPFAHPRVERNTSSGGSGLKARIISPNTPPRNSRDAAGSVFDQVSDEEDIRKDGKASAKDSSSSSGPPGASNQNHSSGGPVVFAGNDRSNDGAMNARVGPLERNRQQRDTGGGNAGLRVRIIPADAPPGSSRTSGSVFDNRDAAGGQHSQGGATAQGTSQAGQTAQSGSHGPRGSNSTVIDSQNEIASTNSRANGPPVLRRDRPDESSNAIEAEARSKNVDEEAIVLKAALVNLNVSVTNRSGVALANLKKEDFDIAENGDAQKIEFFQPTTAPFNLVLALDLSGSIKDKIDVVKSAALRFLEVVGPQDKVAVVTFTDEIRVVSQLTSDRDELKRRIKAIDKSQGGTAFYEALWFALMDTLRGTRGQRNAIVVMTDGVDSSLDRYNPMESRVSFNQLAHRLEESDVIVFPIYLDTEYEEVFERGNSSSEAYAIARDQLERLGEVSGGQMFKAEKFGDLSGVYKQVAAAIRTVYSVGYYPTNSERDGTFRRVRIVVNRPDAAVRARKGYYAK